MSQRRRTTFVLLTKEKLFTKKTISQAISRKFSPYWTESNTSTGLCIFPATTMVCGCETAAAQHRIYKQTTKDTNTNLGYIISHDTKMKWRQMFVHSLFLAFFLSFVHCCCISFQFSLLIKSYSIPFICQSYKLIPSRKLKNI